MIFLKLWFGLVVRYRLPGRQRMECPPFSFVCELLLRGPLRFDHLLLAFPISTSRRIASERVIAFGPLDVNWTSSRVCFPYSTAILLSGQLLQPR
jgi:hypothetical protein